MIRPWVKENRYIVVLSLLFVVSISVNEIDKTSLLAVITMSALTALAGHHIFKKALMDLRYRIIGIDLLVTIAVVAAFFIGDLFEAAAVTYLFTLGHVLEKKSLEKTRSALAALMDLRPVVARIIRNGVEAMIPQSDLMVGDTLIVKAGETIPTDGIIVEGHVVIDEQIMTGESLPVTKTIGDSIYGATLLTSGYLIMEATHVKEDTTLSRIIHMVEEAQDNKAKTQKFMERFSAYYTPSIVLISAFIFILTRDIRLSITLLVIACPGALVIATPVSFVAGIGNAARKGILFKGGDAIERLAKGNIVFFDKTGTLTQGKPEIKAIKSYRMEGETLLKIAAIGETYSEHPLAHAFTSAIKEREIKLTEAPTHTNVIIGKGITFVYNEVTYSIGNQKMIAFELNEAILNDMSKFELLGYTTLILADEHEVLGLFGIADALRESSKDVIQALKGLNIKKTIMLTGDEQRIADAVAKELGIDTVYASLLPMDKAKIVNQYKEFHHTVFVGDGINDAVALSYADTSVAVGGLGKDIAMETADVVLMSGNISKLTEAILISRKVRTNMLQNIAFALSVVVMLMIGVVFKTINMSLGMLIHEISVLLVVINAIRLLRYRRGGTYEKRSRARQLHQSRSDIQEP